MVVLRHPYTLPIMYIKKSQRQSDCKNISIQNQIGTQCILVELHIKISLTRKCHTSAPSLFESPGRCYWFWFEVSFVFAPEEGGCSLQDLSPETIETTFILLMLPHRADLWCKYTYWPVWVTAVHHRGAWKEQLHVNMLDCTKYACTFTGTAGFGGKCILNLRNRFRRHSLPCNVKIWDRFIESEISDIYSSRVYFPVKTMNWDTDSPIRLIKTLDPFLYKCVDLAQLALAWRCVTAAERV